MHSLMKGINLINRTFNNLLCETNKNQIKFHRIFFVTHNKAVNLTQRDFFSLKRFSLFLRKLTCSLRVIIAGDSTLLCTSILVQKLDSNMFYISDSVIGMFRFQKYLQNFLKQIQDANMLIKFWLISQNHSAQNICV